MSAKFARPDFSEYLVHFTKDPAPLASKDETDPHILKIASMTAKDRLISILNSRRIRATRMPWTNKPAVCFTECTWASLFEHTKRYSRYGIGFTKKHLFSKGGAPAIYLPPGLMEHQKGYARPKSAFADELFAFITPFCPPYAPDKYKNRFWSGKKDVDFTHEREWRTPHDLDFSLSEVEFVIVATYEDMAKAPKNLKDRIGRDKWLLMNNYEKVERLWPVHILP